MIRGYAMYVITFLLGSKTLEPNQASKIHSPVRLETIESF